MVPYSHSDSIVGGVSQGLRACRNATVAQLVAVRRSSSAAVPPPAVARVLLAWNMPRPAACAYPTRHINEPCQLEDRCLRHSCLMLNMMLAGSRACRMAEGDLSAEASRLQKMMLAHSGGRSCRRQR